MHRVSKWQSWDSNIGSLASDLCLELSCYSASPWNCFHWLNKFDFYDSGHFNENPKSQVLMVENNLQDKTVFSESRTFFDTTLS